MQSKKALILGIILITLSLAPLASAGFFDLFTGRATSAGTNVTATVTSNTAPEVRTVLCSNSTGSFLACSNVNSTIDLAEGTTTSRSYNVTVFDLDGATDINLTQTFLNVSYTNCNGESRNRGALCTNQSVPSATSNTLSFTCTVTFQYFDCASNETNSWKVNATTKDIFAGARGENSSQNQSINSLTAVTVAPLSITLSNLTVGVANVTSDNNNTINNTGNTQALTVELNSTNLVGNVLTGFVLYAGNFTSATANSTGAQTNATGLNNVCQGTQLINYDFIVTANSTASYGFLPKVQTDAGNPNQFITNRYCVNLVPSLPRQNYTTSAEGAWTLKATF